MQLDREPDVADVARHVVADAGPATVRTVDAVDAAVVLLIEPVGTQRMHAHAVRVVPERGVGVRQRSRMAQPVLSGCQSFPPSVLSNTPPPDRPM